ncbi:MAG: BrnA antitoxin family protein [Bradyrhizobiaceae bacterium]|nr:BrnA antitoxin family protein [Bradyrhizobiaceae bacterium]
MPAKKRVFRSRPDDENPEWTDRDFARATPHIGGKPVSMEKFRKAVAAKMGRPKSDDPKQPVKLRLDTDVIAHFRAGGRGWQTRINAALRKVARLPSRKAAAPRPRTSSAKERAGKRG